MDTGSGKTHIAIARILAELERNDKVGSLLASPLLQLRMYLGSCDPDLIPSIPARLVLVTICGAVVRINDRRSQ